MFIMEDRKMVLTLTIILIHLWSHFIVLTATAIMELTYLCNVETETPPLTF